MYAALSSSSINCKIRSNKDKLKWFANNKKKKWLNTHRCSCQGSNIVMAIFFHGFLVDVLNTHKCSCQISKKVLVLHVVSLFFFHGFLVDLLRSCTKYS